MTIFIEIFKDLKKNDTILAFFVSFCLQYYFTNNLNESVKFSTLFVLIFLFFLNLLF